MDERSRGAADDLRFIKSVLSDSQPGYGAISPLFSGICVIWWVYSLLSLALLAFGTRFAYAGNEAAFGRYSRLSSLPELLLCAALLCAYLVLRRGKGTSAFGCSKRLAGVWSVSIFAFALARLALLVLTILGNRVPGIFGGGTPDFSALVRVGTAATALGRALFIVFPAIPLMITARLLANRALTALGVLSLAAFLLWALLLSFFTAFRSASGTPPVWNLALCAAAKLSAAAAFSIIAAKFRKDVK